MRNDGRLDNDQVKAAEKFERHLQGAAKQDVRITDAFTESNAAEDKIDYPWIYHGQKLKIARDALLPREWRAIVGLIQGTENLESVGQAFRKCASRNEARGQGLSIVSSGLDRLAYLWGFKARADLS